MTAIRLATPLDAPHVADIYRPAVVDSATSFEIDAPTADEMAVRITSTLQRTPWLVCAVGHDVLGYAYATRHRERAAYQWSVEVSAYVRADARRSGVARGLYESLFAVLALQGFRNAYAAITLPNAPSIGLHRLMGFTPIGVFKGAGYKLGGWHDVQWLHREVTPSHPQPRPPIPLTGVLDRDDLHVALRSGLGHLRLPIP